MSDIEIRKARLNDLEQLQGIGKQTFIETFSSENSEENMKAYLESRFSAEKLKNELADENSEFYFAFSKEQVVGYLKLNTGESQSELKDSSALEIERIYVLKEHHGKKVGQILFNKAIEISKQKEVKYVWLGVWEKNFRAIQFYKKNGFVEFDRHIFRLGNDEQTDIMMKLQIQ